MNNDTPNNNTPDIEQQVADFKQEILNGRSSNPTPPPAEPPANNNPTPPPAEPPANNNPKEFDFTSLSDLSGGIIKDKDSFQSVIDGYKSLSTIKTEYDTLKNAPPKQIEYASELTQKIDELHRNGASYDHIQKFIALQAMDVDKMSKEDAYLNMLRLKYPTLSDDVVQAGLKKELDKLKDEDGNDIAANVFEFETKVVEARQFLTQQKVDSIPKEIRDREQAQQVQTKYRDHWIDIGKSLYNDIKVSHKLTVEGQEPLEISLDLPQEQMDTYVQIAANELASQGLEFKNENVPIVMNYIRGAYILQNLDSVLGQIVQQTKEKISERLAKEYAGMLPKTSDASIPPDDDSRKEFSSFRNDIKSGKI